MGHSPWIQKELDLTERLSPTQHTHTHVYNLKPEQTSETNLKLLLHNVEV